MVTDSMSCVSQSPPPEALSCFASGSNSPQISKTPSFQKQRSSSVNSVGSTHSARQRSMSIVSLESPRNSIVSTEDFTVKPTRNNSNSSLSSMNAFISSAAVSPVDPPRDALFMKLSKIRPKPTELISRNCAIVSDDEYSESEQTFRTLRWRRSSSERPSGLASSLKRDFHFKYDSKQRVPMHPSHGSSTGQQKFSEDLVPSPLSISGDCTPAQETPGLMYLGDSDTVSRQASPVGGVSKKTKASHVSHSMLLKKKFLFSKDIQLELPSGQPHGSKAKFPSDPFATPNQIASEPPASSQHSIFSLPKNPHSNVADDSFLHVRPPSPVNPSVANAPYEMTLKQQNKLISDLNRKWNKSLFHTRSSDFSLAMTHITDPKPGRSSGSKKRARSESVSSTDSLTTNIT